MATPVAALEDCSFLSMTAGGAPVVAHKASPERLRELDNILSRALPRFRRIAMRWLGNHEDAEDAVQDAMLSAFKHIADFEGRAQMSTWLTAVVINAVRMQIGQLRSKLWNNASSVRSSLSSLTVFRPISGQLCCSVNKIVFP